MKEYIKNCLNFLKLVFIFFLLIFVCSILFHLFSLVGIEVKDQVLATIIRPSLFFSVYSSFIISCILYGIFYLKKVTRLVMLTFFFPLFFTTAVLGGLYFFLKPTGKDIKFLQQKDARLYLTEKAFIKYNQDIPGKLDTEKYNALLMGAYNEEQKTVLRKSYVTDKTQSYYQIKEDLNFQEKKKLQSVLYSITRTEPILFYFNRVYKEYVEDLIVIKDKQLFFYSKVATDFDNGELIIRLPLKEDAFKFIKMEFLNDTIFDILGIKIFFDRYKSALKPFFYYSPDPVSLIRVLLLWFCWCFIILSASNCVFMEKFPLMNLVLNLCIFLGIFLLLEWLYPFYRQLYTFQKLFDGKGYEYLIFCAPAMFILLLKNSVAYLFERGKA